VLRPALAFSLFLGACGGAGASGSTTPEPCADEDAALSAASEALATCRSTPPEAWRHEEGYAHLVAALDHYSTRLELEGDGDEVEAQAIATESWSFLDELASDVVDHGPLDTAEDATEALLRDREHDEALEAVGALRSALATLHDRLAAPAEPDCTAQIDDETDARDAQGRCHAD
jgi:hypothetical protein